MQTLTVSLAASALLLAGCVPDRADAPTSFAADAPYDGRGAASAIAAYPVDPGFGNYWYQGKAEITSYDLKQLHYGEPRAGKAVLIFVTEDFSRSRHVKLEGITRTDGDKVTVLKLNSMKEFITGIYPYSLMSSVFTPLSGDRDPHSLKVTTSVQEWCGHTFVQIDLRENVFHVAHHSYFESEADQTVRLAPVILEDELWSKIRINPGALPTGDARVIAGTQFQRLSRSAFAVEHASAALATDDAVSSYTLAYEHRTLTIRFSTAFPHEIVGWEESITQDSGDATRVLATQAVRDTTILLDYWTHNSLTDEVLREVLNLE